MRRSRRDLRKDKYGSISQKYWRFNRETPFGEQSAIIGDMIEKESHGGEVLMEREPYGNVVLVEMESLRSSHPNPKFFI